MSASALKGDGPFSSSWCAASKIFSGTVRSATFTLLPPALDESKSRRESFAFGPTFRRPRTEPGNEGSIDTTPDPLFTDECFPGRDCPGSSNRGSKGFRLVQLQIYSEGHSIRYDRRQRYYEASSSLSRACPFMISRSSTVA